MFGTKTTRSRGGRHKNNSPKGGTDGELYGRHENNLPKDGELNGWHENKGWTAQNNSQKGWTDGELNGLNEITGQNFKEMHEVRVKRSVQK